VIVLPLESVETPGTNAAPLDPGRIAGDRPELLVTAGEHQAHGAVPGVIMQPPVGIRLHEAVEVDVPTERSEDVIALQIRSAVLPIDEAAGQMRAQTVQQTL
jgi:hypothetical protein